MFGRAIDTLCIAALILVVSFGGAVVVNGFELPRHVTEVTHEKQMLQLLYEDSAVVAAVVGSLATPTETDTTLLEAYVNASMFFVEAPPTDVYFTALSSASPTDPTVEELPKHVVTWIAKSSPIYHKRGMSSGIFVFKRTQGPEADRLWTDWANSTDDVDVPIDALPVSVKEVLLPAGNVDTLASAIVSRVKCMIGPNVRELTTEADLEEFLLSTCSQLGLSVIAWPRAALWPFTQKVGRDKLSQLAITQRAVATLAWIERPFTSFAWIDNDAPLVKNTSLIAYLNGAGAPAVAYVCDEKCREAQDPLSMTELHLRFYPFQPFDAVRDMPATDIRDFIQIGLTDWYAEVNEALTESIVDIDVGVSIDNFPVVGGGAASASSQEAGDASGSSDSDDSSSYCEERIKKGDVVQVVITGEALSFDSASRLKTANFYRSNDLVKGDAHEIGKKNPELPVQFGTQSELIYDKLCLNPPSRAFVTLRANRHYNVTDLPPRVEPYATLFFEVEILGRGRAGSLPTTGSGTVGGGERPPEQPDYSEEEDPEALDPDSLKYVELSPDPEPERIVTSEDAPKSETDEQEAPKE